MPRSVPPLIGFEACPTDQTLSAWLEGAAKACRRATVEAHLAGCAACGGVVGARLRGTTEALPAPERFELRAPVGRGAMGRVWAAFDRVLGTLVALKWTILAGADRARRRALVQREAASLARVRHPNVVALHDVVPVAGHLALVMDYVEGPTLSAWLSAATRSLRDVVERFREAGEGLWAAHQQGVVHRDFKPANVIVRNGRTAVLVDFGLARLCTREDAAALASPLPEASVAGTPRYLAPEVAAGEDADPRSDQFSWAVALFEALTGVRPPLQGGASQRVPCVSVPRLTASTAFEALPVALREVLRQCLSVRREERFSTLHDALAALPLSSLDGLTVQPALTAPL